MGAAELVGLIASIASLVLAVGAIWLSVVFFKMSNEAAKATTEAAKGIDASVKRLENLFDKLYSDTFSMMKDTVSDMRKHIWSGADSQSAENKDAILDEADKKAEEKVAEVRKAVERRLSAILDRQREADGNVSEIKKELERLLVNTIQTSRQIDSEAREETLREHLLAEVRKASRLNKGISALELDSLFSDVRTDKLVAELMDMRSEGLIVYAGDIVLPNTRVRVPSITERSKHDGESLRGGAH